MVKEQLVDVLFKASDRWVVRSWRLRGGGGQGWCRGIAPPNALLQQWQDQWLSAVGCCLVRSRATLSWGGGGVLGHQQEEHCEVQQRANARRGVAVQPAAVQYTQHDVCVLMLVKGLWWWSRMQREVEGGASRWRGCL